MSKNIYQKSLEEARLILGSYDAIGKASGGLSGKAVMRWYKNGKPPRTEYTGETNYAQLIELACEGKVKADSLLPKIEKINVLREIKPTQATTNPPS
jgi:hypothetical protein